MPERVVADRGQEVDPGAETRRADRLVRPLAAVVGAEGAADDGLPRLGHPLELDGEPDPVAADDRDPRHAADPMQGGARPKTGSSYANVFVTSYAAPRAAS